MLKRIIDWSIDNRLIVFLFTLAAIAAGAWAVSRTPLEALPDLSDVQVIVQAEYNDQAPRIVEDQVTYPIAAEMLKVPGSRTVRGYSFFGISFVYVIFEDGTDLYWARSRVLEYLNGIKGKLPANVTPTLGPDATGLGWVYQYALEDTTGRKSLAELRSIQDWYLRYALTAVPGVSEVAALGGFEKQYQIDLDPAKLLGYRIPITAVMAAIQNANADIGAMVVELSEREYMVRGLGYLKSLADIENVVVGATASGTPIRVAELGQVSVGPAVRRGIAELDGRGDAVGGIVIMRFGQNALTTIGRVKDKIKEIQRGLPEGVVLTPVYDRSDLIHRAIENLRGKLIEESLVVAAVCIIFLLHARSALVAILTLPLGILMAFIAMRWVGVGADIMSLGGIAIAIGAMIDAAIVMIENMHKHLERAVDAKERAMGRSSEGRSVDSSILTAAERWTVVRESSKEVGPALFISLLIITVSFLPVFTLEGQEGRLFKPLAFTKTFAMAAASLLSVTLVPVTMGLFIRGKIYRERANPINRWLIAVYRPVITFVLRRRWPVIGAALVGLVLTLIPWSRIGGEFMPPLGEGTILFMPTTLPGVSVARAREILRVQDAILKSFPEVDHVWGKAGRANTATDPAGLDMIETTITLKPESEWRDGMTYDALVSAMDSAVRLPGITNAWTMPIKARIDMLATGIRTPVGIKIFGPDLAELERLGKEVERAVQMVRGTRSAFAERAVSGYYLDIDIDRAAAARHGLNVGDVQTVIATAVGGMVITQTVEGRERYGVRDPQRPAHQGQRKLGAMPRDTGALHADPRATNAAATWATDCPPSVLWRTASTFNSGLKARRNLVMQHLRPSNIEGSEVSIKSRLDHIQYSPNFHKSFGSLYAFVLPRPGPAIKAEEDLMSVPRRDFLRAGLLVAGGAAAVAVERVIGDGDALASASADPAATGRLALTADGELVTVPAGAAAAVPPPTPDEARRGIPGRKWVMVIDLARCDGCGKCVTACADAHFLPPDREWLRLFKMRNSADAAPYWFPRPCFHCDDPPCTRVCPVGATFKRQDGIVLVDNERCIGCRFCMAACPYSVRTFNWGKPENPPQATARGYSPEWGYPRRVGTTEKCDFCPDMARQGKLPHCAAACPMGAIWFGDQNEDAVTNGEEETVRFSQLLRDKGGYRYLEELGTKPRVHYLPPTNREYPAPGEPDAEKGAPLRGEQR